jgi:tRNA(His) 5'-end guanylyltransferase
MSDTLGDRMKERYENRTRYYLPRRSFAVVRVDGKSFHTFTRNCAKPFDHALMDAIDGTAAIMCSEMEGAVLAYTQSDEISVLLCDFKKQDSQGWFDYNLQKICSVSAALATAGFNRLYKPPVGEPALFDARVFSIADPVEVMNYFIWRQKDAERNSLQMAAQALYSHKDLHGKKCPHLHELLHAKSLNWNDYTAREKRGGFIVRTAENRGWSQIETPIFAKTQDQFMGMLPVLGYDK